MKGTSILLFGDQTGDWRTTLGRVLKVQDNVLLQVFLDRSFSAIRSEVAHVAASEPDHAPRFSNIAELVATYADSEGPKSNALESALTCVAQLACFFW